MTIDPNLEPLRDLQKRLVLERSRILGDLAAAPDPLPDGALRRLAEIQAAAAGVAEEIEVHTPKLGHGGES